MKLIYSILLLTILILGIVVAQPISQTPIKTDQIKFTSQPPSTGIVGITYTYTAKAISSDSTAKIWYAPYQLMMSLFSPSYKYTVDSATGLLKFVPQAKGWYTLGIIAHSTKGGSATQLFSVTITGGNGIVQGKITDTFGTTVIKGAVVELFKTVSITSSGSQTGGNATSDPAVFQGDGSYSFSAVTDASGSYQITGIDPGTYKMHVTSPTRLYESLWYDGKSSAAQADTINIVNNKTTPINIKLPGGVNQQKVAISGSVLDTLKKAIKNAEIVFVSIGFALNSNDSDDNNRDYFDLNSTSVDCTLGGTSQQVIHILDSSNGTFIANIAPGTYIAYAQANGYVTQFYKEQYNLLLATPIVVKRDTPVTNINFTLAPVPASTGSISGSVLDSSKNIGVRSRIIVSNASNPARAYFADTDTLGKYSVTKIANGTYYVLAVPLGNYAPSYYTTDTASIRWNKAKTITITGNSVTGITIYVYQFAVSTSGYASVGGKVRLMGVSSTVIPGAFVYALKNNQVAGYCITDNSGSYSVNGLAPGSYSITVDNIGSNVPTSSVASISYTSTGAPVAATVDFSLSTTTGVETSTPAQPVGFTLSQNYPNPFNPSTVIKYTIKQPGIVALKVYNILGQEIQTLVSNYQVAGNYQVILNAQNLSSGVYFYRLQSNNKTLMRKMILLR